MLDQVIIKVALLGLKAKKFRKDIFPTKVQEYLPDSQDEETFLNALSLTYKYLESGKEISKIDKINSLAKICPSENLDYVEVEQEKYLQRICQNDYLKYSLLSYLKILSEDVVAQNKIFKSDQITKILEELNLYKKNEKANYHIAQYFKNYNYREVYTLQKFENIVIKSFGNTGQWILEMMSPKELVENEDLSEKERKNKFEAYCFNEKEKITPFLEEFFHYEKPSIQKYYLKTLSTILNINDVEILEFFKQYFIKYSGKRIETLKNIFDLIKIIIDNEHIERKVFEDIFKNIWKKRTLLKKSLKLKTKKELEVILEPLDKYEFSFLPVGENLREIDLKLHILFLIIPIDKASIILNEKKAKYLTAVSSINSFNKQKSINHISAFSMNIFKSKDKESALEFIKLSKISKHFSCELFLLFDDDELYKILEDNFEIVEFIDGNIFDILIKELNVKKTWSEKLTKHLIDHILVNQHFYSIQNRFYQALWLGGPYFHKNVAKITEKIANSATHKNAWKRGEIQEYIIVVDKLNKLKS